MASSQSSRNSPTGMLPDQEAFQQAIAKERQRSDRSSYTYSLLILSLAIESEEDERFRRAIAAIRKRIRVIDEMGWYKENQLGIILPFTAMQGADQLADDICGIITSHLEPSEYLACELFSYDPESIPESEIPVWKKNLKA